MRWIVVDGIDGSGKSTCARWIAGYYELRGEKVLLRIHPSTRWAGKMTRRALEGRGKAMRLLATFFFILDVLGSLSRLRKDRREYDTVVFVRYIMGAAYLPDRLAKPGYDFIAKVLPLPRRLLLVDIDPEVAARRISERMERSEMFEDTDSLARTRAKVLRLAERGWEKLDNSASAESSQAELVRILQSWDSVAD